MITAEPETVDEQPTVIVQPAEPSVEEIVEVVEERPERPWTPSYSVTTQGPGTPNGKMHEIEDTDDALDNGPQVFPSSEGSAPDTRSIATKPSLARLATVDEHEQIKIDLDGQSLDTLTSPVTARARLESTTSSRFFPGGWFSSAPKSAEENRMSLENAAGEFSSPTGMKDSPALEVPTNTPIDGVIDEKKRGKWCIIM